MNLYIYADESGVFDKINNDIFVFAGIICLGYANKEKLEHMYAKAEKVLKQKKAYKHMELKASLLSYKDKSKLFRSLNNFYKFAIVVDQRKLLDEIFMHKKLKQRFMDFAFKKAIKSALSAMISEQIIHPANIDSISFFLDEHSSPTNTKYELRESLEQELKYGSFTDEYKTYIPPILKGADDIHLSFCNSKSKLLIRAADIVANKFLFLGKDADFTKMSEISNINICFFPDR